jgi:putative oxidoreductase
MGDKIISHSMCVLLIDGQVGKVACYHYNFYFSGRIGMLHSKEGWYVVGGGRNGIEFNFLLIFALLTIIFPNGFKKASAKNAWVNWGKAR